MSKRGQHGRDQFATAADAYAAATTDGPVSTNLQSMTSYQKSHSVNRCIIYLRNDCAKLHADLI